MRTAAIMQPTYLPYLGYFRLIASADVFVFLDDVQFARRSWQQRNRILGANGEVMLTVPVKKSPRDTRICDIGISYAEPWPVAHLDSIQHAYRKRPFHQDGLWLMESQLAQVPAWLVELNINLICEASRLLGLETPFVRASSLGVTGSRSDHLMALCQAVGATEYLSPEGSRAYMVEDGLAFTDGAYRLHGMPVRFQSFVEIPYDQGRETFTPYLSFLDAVMNLGWEGTRDLIDRMGGATI